MPTEATAISTGGPPKTFSAKQHLSPTFRHSAGGCGASHPELGCSGPQIVKRWRRTSCRDLDGVLPESWGWLRAMAQKQEAERTWQGCVSSRTFFPSFLPNIRGTPSKIKRQFLDFFSGAGGSKCFFLSETFFSGNSRLRIYFHLCPGHEARQVLFQDAPADALLTVTQCNATRIPRQKKFSVFKKVPVARGRFVPTEATAISTGGPPKTFSAKQHLSPTFRHSAGGCGASHPELGCSGPQIVKRWRRTSCRDLDGVLPESWGWLRAMAQKQEAERTWQGCVSSRTFFPSFLPNIRGTPSKIKRQFLDFFSGAGGSKCFFLSETFFSGNSRLRIYFHLCPGHEARQVLFQDAPADALLTVTQCNATRIPRQKSLVCLKISFASAAEKVTTKNSFAARQ